MLTRYEDCLAVLRDGERFASDTARAAGRLGDHVRGLRRLSPLGDHPLFGQTDPPDHPRLRSIINRAFTPRVIEAHRPRVRAVVDELLDALPAGEPFDFMTTVAERLPVLVIGDLLGLDAESRGPVRERAQAIMQAVSEDQLTPAQRRAADDATAWLRDFLARYAQEHGDEPERRLIRILLDAEAEGGRLSDEELLAFTVFLYSAGSGPTAGLLGNGLVALLQHPDELARLRAQPDLVMPATDELLRYDSPTQVLIRVAAADVQVGRRRIAAGDTLLVMTGAANRDPEAFPEPDHLDVTRERASRHLSFGYGSHFCLGAPLAQLEADELLRALFERFPSLAIAANGLERGGTFLIRVPRRLVLLP